MLLLLLILHNTVIWQFDPYESTFYVSLNRGTLEASSLAACCLALLVLLLRGNIPPTLLLWKKKTYYSYIQLLLSSVAHSQWSILSQIIAHSFDSPIALRAKQHGTRELISSVPQSRDTRTCFCMDRTVILLYCISSTNKKLQRKSDWKMPTVLSHHQGRATCSSTLQTLHE